MGEQLFPSETVLLENVHEMDERAAALAELLIDESETELVAPASD